MFYNILLEYLKNEQFPYEVYRQIKLFNRKINDYLVLEDSLQQDSCVLFDEGMIRKHPGITEYGIRTYSTEELQKDEALNPAGIISCEQSSDVIFDQALHTKKQCVLTNIKGSICKEELREHVELGVENHNSKILLFKENNIPVLNIDTRAKKKKIINEINNFVSGVAGKK